MMLNALARVAAHPQLPDAFPSQFEVDSSPDLEVTVMSSALTRSNSPHRFRRLVARSSNPSRTRSDSGTRSQEDRPPPGNAGPSIPTDFFRLPPNQAEYSSNSGTDSDADPSFRPSAPARRSSRTIHPPARFLSRDDDPSPTGANRSRTRSRTVNHRRIASLGRTRYRRACSTLQLTLHRHPYASLQLSPHRKNGYPSTVLI